MRKAVNILFLGGAKRVSMARMFMAAGKRLGLDVNLFSYELSAQVPIAEVATVIIGRRWRDADLMDHLRETVEENRIDVMIPFVDPAVEIAVRYCMNDHSCFTPGSNPDMIAKMFDKVEADEVFRHHGFPLPVAASEVSDAEIIAKPRCGSASKGIRVITMSEYRQMCANGEAEAYLCQQYVARRMEFTVDCYVATDRRVVCTVPRQRIEVAGGEVTVTQTVHDKEMESWCDRILGKLGLTGAVTIQFLREHDAEGRLMLMEINPRLGGGAVCAVHAGADIPEFILREWLGQRLEPCAQWKDGLKICRYLSEVVFENAE